MNFDDARKGVRLLYQAAIFELLATLIASVSLLFVSAGTPGLIGTFVLAIAALVLEIIAFVQNIRGLNLAGREESYFKYAFWLVIVGIVISCIGTFFPSDGTISVIIEICNSVFDMVTPILICLGVGNLFALQGNGEMADKGRKTAIIFAVVYAVSQIIEMILSFGSTNLGAAATGIILGVAVIVLAIVAYVRFLMYLKSASDIL